MKVGEVHYELCGEPGRVALCALIWPHTDFEIVEITENELVVRLDKLRELEAATGKRMRVVRQAFNASEEKQHEDR